MLVGFSAVTIAVSGVLIAQELVAAEGNGLISRYLDVGREAAREQVGRNDNAALLHVASDRFRWPGVLVMLMLIAAVLFTALRRRELDSAYLRCLFLGIRLAATNCVGLLGPANDPGVDCRLAWATPRPAHRRGVRRRLRTSPALR